MTTSSLTQNLNTSNAKTNSKTETHLLGTFTLRELTITLKNGAVIDLGQAYQAMEFYEDIFKYSIRGKIRVRDFVGGQEKFVITGGEKIKVTVLKPNGMNDILVSRSDLIVTKISDITMDGLNGRLYDLFIATELSINSLKRKLFKSYGNERNLNKVIQNIYTEMGGNSSELLTTNASGVSLNNPFISPGYSPLDAINALAKRAGVNEDYFLFFERFVTRPNEKFKHIFIGVDGLRKYWENLKTIPKIIFEPKVGMVNYVGKTETENLIMSDYAKVESNFDHVTNIATGFYNSRVRSIDLLNRNYIDTSLNYLNDPIRDVYNNKILEKDNPFSKFDDTSIERLIILPTNDSVTNKSKWLKYDTYGGMLSTSIRLTVRISGGSNYIGVGSLVELSVPSDFSKTINLENPTPHEDQMYSGKYLVTAVKHVISPKAYEKVLELSRGSLKFNVNQLIEKYKVK